MGVSLLVMYLLGFQICWWSLRIVDWDWREREREREREKGGGKGKDWSLKSEWHCFFWLFFGRCYGNVLSSSPVCSAAVLQVETHGHSGHDSGGRVGTLVISHSMVKYVFLLPACNLLNITRIFAQLPFVVRISIGSLSTPPHSSSYSIGICCSDFNHFFLFFFLPCHWALPAAGSLARAVWFLLSVISWWCRKRDFGQADVDPKRTKMQKVWCWWWHSFF